MITQGWCGGESGGEVKEEGRVSGWDDGVRRAERGNGRERGGRRGWKW